jgi:hypothetical protein
MGQESFYGRSGGGVGKAGYRSAMQKTFTLGKLHRKWHREDRLPSSE